jgi:hypothetical protein
MANEPCEMLCSWSVDTEGSIRYPLSVFSFHDIIRVLQKVVIIRIALTTALQPFFGPRPLFQFLDFFTQSVGLLGRGISPSQHRYLHTGQYKHIINAHRYSCLRLRVHCDL